MHTYQRFATCFSSKWVKQPPFSFAYKPMKIWFRHRSTKFSLHHMWAVYLSIMFLAVLPNTAYSVSISVDVAEFSAFGAQGASQKQTSDSFADARVQLGDGRPTFGFSPSTPYIGATVAEAVSFGSEDGTFGGYVVTTSGGSGGNNDTLGQSGGADGVWSEAYVRDANTTEIPFRISNTRLMLIDASIESTPNPTMNASLFLAIFAGAGDSTAAWAEQVSIGAPNGRFEITDQPINLTGDFTVTRSPLIITDSGVIPPHDVFAEYVFDTYEGSIDISNINPGESFDLNFAWLIDANQGLGESGAFASFYDPVGDSGGVSFDLTGLTPVDAGNPVPIPGAAWLFLSGLLFLGRRSRLTSTYQQ